MIRPTSPTRRPSSGRPGAAGTRARAAGLACALLLAACGGGDPEARADGGDPAGPEPAKTDEPAAPTGAASEALERRVAPVLSILTPPPADAISSETNSWLDARRAFLEGLGEADAELGRALIATLRARPELERVVQRGLVEAVARTGVAEGGPFLSELVLEYGADLGVRTTAAQNLHRIAPALAAETLGPLLRRPPRATLPPAEILLEGWLSAVRTLGEDPTEILALVATDLRRDDSARVLAVKALGDTATPGARAALETILVESTGNFYLRRMAAQAVVRAFGQDEACALLERVLSREADQNMLLFLSDLFELHCR